MTNVYIDFERNEMGELIEIGAVAVDEHSGKIREFHELIKQELNNRYKYNICAENSHCIEHETLMKEGIAEHKAIILFENFINHCKLPVVFNGHGPDINENYMCLNFPFLKRGYYTYKQINLPGWNVRDNKDYFLATYLMKTTSKMFSCSSKLHSMNYLPFKLKKKGKLNTNAQNAKNKFGFHCALMDSYLIAFYERDIPCYCCDEHFKRNFEDVPQNSSSKVYKIKGLYPDYDSSTNPFKPNELIIEYCFNHCLNLPFVYIGNNTLCNPYIAPLGFDVVD